MPPSSNDGWHRDDGDGHHARSGTNESERLVWVVISVLIGVIVLLFVAIFFGQI